MPGATDSSELENLAPCLPESCLEISATDLKRTALWYLCWSKQQGRRQERGNLLPVGSQDRHFWWGAIYSHAQPQRLEGANQVLGVGHSRQRKELIKRLLWDHKPATDGVTDGRRERRITDTPTASLHWLSQHAFAFTHTFPSAWNLSLLLTLCHLKGPSSGRHPLTLQRRTKLQESIPPYLCSHST